MAVYTEVTDEALEEFLAAYPLGGLVAFRGIAEGVENSNYALKTEAGDFILTLYEKRVDPRELPYFLGLMEHLAAHGLNCPKPVPARDGVALRAAGGRAGRDAQGRRRLRRGTAERTLAEGLGAAARRLPRTRGRGAGRAGRGTR